MISGWIIGWMGLVGLKVVSFGTDCGWEEGRPFVVVDDMLC